MSPPLALLLGPLAAVPVVLLMESTVATPMLIELRREVRWNAIGPIIAAACVTMPLGTWLLASADPLLMRRLIAAVVIVFCALLWRGWRYSGAHRRSTGVGLGALAGTMTGATGMGGPPVILYLMAGPDSIATTRANLTYFMGAIALAGVAILAFGGHVGTDSLLLAAIIAPGYYLAMVAGTRLFSRFNDLRFRQFTLAFMMVVAVGILVA
jgi:uncharacterized protein